jgi:subtilisin family serine protease
MTNHKLLKTSCSLLGVLLLISEQNLAIIDSDGQLFNPIDHQPIKSIIVKFNENSSLKKMSMQEFSEYMSEKINLELIATKQLSSGAIVFKIIHQSKEFMSPQQSISFNTILNSKLIELQKDENIKYADQNSYFHMQKTPNDIRYAEQWNYFENDGGINLPSAWDITTGSNKIIVSVIDTGIVKHKQLANKLTPGRNFVDDGNTADDPTDRGGQTSYHGSHVAGTIGAVTDQYGSIAGIAWNTKIQPVRVLNNQGIGSLAQIIEGMRWSVGISDIDNLYPAKILNLSLSGFGKCQPSLQETIDDITQAGGIVVVAAGNSALPAKLFSPANCNNVITVGASDRNGNQAFYSNYGIDTVDIIAPGGDKRTGEEGGILSLGAPGKVQFLQGTSMATPHISGLIALMLSLKPYLTLEEITKYLQSSVKNNTMEIGLVDANKVLNMLKNNQINE